MHSVEFQCCNSRTRLVSAQVRPYAVDVLVHGRLGSQLNATSYDRPRAVVVAFGAMYLCYIDESGGFEAPNSGNGATPLMLFAGLIVPADAVAPLTNDFLALKRKFFPGKASKHLDYLLAEVKGSDLRAGVRSTSRRKQRHAIGVLDAVVGLIEKHDVRLVGRVWIKDPTKGLEPSASYTFAIQDIARHFNHFLDINDSAGLVLCDGRLHRQDAQVAHSLFTQKYKTTGDALPRLVEAAVFGRSENHAGLQLADIVASAILFPMAARVYCVGKVTGVHVQRRLDLVRTRYAVRLRPRQYLYKDAGGRTRGGMVVSDKLGKRPSRLLFEPPNGSP